MRRFFAELPGVRFEGKEAISDCCHPNMIHDITYYALGACVSAVRPDTMTFSSESRTMLTYYERCIIVGTSHLHDIYILQGRSATV